MVHEEKKVAKIVEELTLFFFALGAEHIRSGIAREGRLVTISFEADYRPEYGERLQSLDKYLNEPKNDGIEDIYWELAGSGEPGETSQLLLVGMMVDRADIKLQPGLACLTLFKELLE